MTFISLRRKSKTQSQCQKKNLVILVAYDSVDIHGLVKMAVLGRNYRSVGKGRKVTAKQPVTTMAVRWTQLI
jgi:hypothetical protein